MSDSIEVDVHGQTKGGYQLSVTLNNATKKPVEVYEHSLPWVGWYSLLLVAAKTDQPGTLLEKRLPVDDPGPGTVTLEPGQKQTGSIDLTKRFPGFTDALKQRDVVVFWSYRSEPVGEEPLPRAAGAVTFAKGS